MLSQYLTAIQCAGRYPPQETGLTFNSWEGKFHLEMHWWHAAHFALWGRLRAAGAEPRLLRRDPAARAGDGEAPGLLRRPLAEDDRARAARSRRRASGRSSSGSSRTRSTTPSSSTASAATAPRSSGSADVVFETAEFMASYAVVGRGRAALRAGADPPGRAGDLPEGPHRSTPAFELAYWRWGLETAQRWRERLGLAREPRWQRVLDHLAAPPGPRRQVPLRRDGARELHRPALGPRSSVRDAGPSACCPGPGSTVTTMRRTLRLDLGELELAGHVGLGLPDAWPCARRAWASPSARSTRCSSTRRRTRYRPNGHNHQRPGLTIYLPGNGGLLAAVAMMAAGWDGAPGGHAPGFPADGSWQRALGGPAADALDCGHGTLPLRDRVARRPARRAFGPRLFGRAGAGSAEARDHPPDERRGRSARGRGDGKAPREGGPDAGGLRRPRGRQAAAGRPVPGVHPPPAGPARSNGPSRGIGARGHGGGRGGGPPARALRGAGDRRRPHGVREPLPRPQGAHALPRRGPAARGPGGARDHERRLRALAGVHVRSRGPARDPLPPLRAGPPSPADRHSLHQRVPGRAHRERGPDGARRSGAGGPAGRCRPGP